MNSMPLYGWVVLGTFVVLMGVWAILVVRRFRRRRAERQRRRDYLDGLDIPLDVVGSLPLPRRIPGGAGVPVRGSVADDMAPSGGFHTTSSFGGQSMQTVVVPVPMSEAATPSLADADLDGDWSELLADGVSGLGDLAEGAGAVAMGAVEVAGSVLGAVTEL